MGVVIVEGEGAVLAVILVHPIVTNGDFRRGSSQITLAALVIFGGKRAYLVNV